MELWINCEFERAIKGVGNQPNNTVKERYYYRESRKKLGIRRATRETATPHCRFRLDISRSVKLIRDGGGKERKESKETNRRGKDLNSIMARNDHGRWKICARGRFVKIKAPFTQRAIRSTSVSTILNVLMEGERNSIQHQEINKSIPFLELIHSLEFSRRIVGKRWSSNPIDLHYTRKETFRFSGGNVTSEKRR